MFEWLIITSTLLIVEQVKPAEVPGFLLIHVCDINPENETIFPEWAYISPFAVVSISEPRDVPIGCSAIQTASGKRIYLYGTAYEIVLKVIQAVSEQRDLNKIHKTP